jgi:hypothetical protein
VIGMSNRLSGRSAWSVVARATAIGLVLATTLACEPGAPPGFTGSPPPATGSAAPVASGPTPAGSAPAAGAPTVTMDGATVKAVGTGTADTPDFQLPAGKAEMTVSVCTSNQVIPFVTLYDDKDNKLAIVVDPTYTIQNLAGGTYYLDVNTNPTCTWTIEITPG